MHHSKRSPLSFEYAGNSFNHNPAISFINQSTNHSVSQMSNPSIARRRSARILQNTHSHRNGATNSLMGRRQAVIRGHGANTTTNSRYSGRKRSKPDSSDPESSDDDGSSSGSEEDSEFETNSNSRSNNGRYSQTSNLNTQPSQQAKRRKLQYRSGKSHEKWKQTQSNVQRRSTRLRYRKLADETMEHRAAIVDPMSNNFMDKLEEQNKIYEDGMLPPL